MNNILSLIILIFFILVVFILFFYLFILNKKIDKNLLELQKNYTGYLEKGNNIFGVVVEKLSEMKSKAENMLLVVKEVQNLQDIFKVPKLRGTFGEVMLEHVLSQVLPSKFYKTSYRFNSGNIVDAVIFLGDSKLLPIDAKFPLDSIKDYLASQRVDKGETPRDFSRSIKKHIDEISLKYIQPQEGTLDYALMYVPAEAVYYEIVANQDSLINYAMEKKVIPVSPNSLFLYLSTVLLGLRGTEIEKNADLILKQIAGLKTFFNNFLDEFLTLGNHLTNAKSKYDLSKDYLTSLKDRLSNIELSKYE